MQWTRVRGMLQLTASKMYPGRSLREGQSQQSKDDDLLNDMERPSIMSSSFQKKYWV